MYSERVQKNVAAWNEPRNIQWVERETQHCGVRSLEEAQEMVANLQKYVDEKKHFLSCERSGPDAHHLTETWIEVEHRCRFHEPSSDGERRYIPNISAIG